jgi:type IV secretion system protein VirD4
MPDARTATQAEAREFLGGGGRGINLGRFYDDATRRAASEPLIYSGDRHAILFGPTGSGKTTRFLMTNLLSDCLNEHSVIVVDPKGQLAAVTAAYRRTLGDVVILNPFGVLGLGSDGFNPLDALDPASPVFYDDAAAIGEALIKIEGNDPYWPQSAQGLMVALVMWEKFCNGPHATLENVRRMLTEPDRYEEVAGAEGKAEEVLVSGFTKTARAMTDKGGFVIESLAARFRRATNEIASIRSAADTQTRWLLSEPMRQHVSASGVDFTKLKDRPMTVYVILPAERMRTHSVWLRLVIVSVLKALYRPGGRRTVMFVDEMAVVGHLGPLQDAFALVRGYGVQIVGILQDLAQLKSLYKDSWESFLANAGVVLGFTPNDMETAKWMSDRSGQTTFVAEGQSRSQSIVGGRRENRGESWQQIARQLRLAHELMGLDAGTGLLWFAGMEHDVRFFAPFYSKIEPCASRAARDPYWNA